MWEHFTIRTKHLRFNHRAKAAKKEKEEYQTILLLNNISVIISYL